jgi:polysaccharide biosynthesis/export protein
MLNCLAKFHLQVSEAFLMESGKVYFTCWRQLRLLAPVCVLALVSAGAQTNSSTQSAPPDAASTGAQPASQMAVGSGRAKSAAQENTNTQQPAIGASGSISGASDDSLLKLGAGDLLEVSVYNVPELATKARVGSSGDVYLPLIDYVHVGELTVEEAQNLIAKRLEDGGFVRSPHVTIFIDESASQGVTVLGEVNKPGIYPDIGDHKLYEIVSQAGGFSTAAARKVSIIRRGMEQPLQFTLPRNLGDDTTNNVDILPGDTVIVPRAPIIYVVGDVGRPSGLLIDNGSLTVLQAIALAGGPNRTAKLNGVRIVHKTPTGMTETIVPFKKMLEAKAPDVTLQADDILFVPVSGGKVFAQRSFEAAMTTAAALTVYSVHP